MSVETQGTTIQVESASAGVYTTVNGVTNISGPGGGSSSVIDVTTLASTRKEFRVGLADEGEVSLELIRDFADSGQNLLRDARLNRTSKNFRITYDDGTVLSFAGYVMTFPLTSPIDEVVRGTVGIKISGAVTQS